MSLWAWSICLLLGAVIAVALIPRVVALISPLEPRSEKSLRLGARRWLRRTSVMVPCVLFGSLFAGALAAPFESFKLWLFVMSGPFAELVANSNPSSSAVIVHGVLTLFGMSLHPIWPNAWTALITFLASGWWFLIGFAFTVASV